MPAQAKQLVSEPLAIDVLANGVTFAESVHSPEFTMGARSDDFYKLVFVLNGKVRFAADNHPLRELNNGSFFPVSRNETHSISDDSPSSLLLLCLGKDFIEDEPAHLEVWQRVLRKFEAGVKPPIQVSQEIFSIWRSAILEQVGIRFGRELSINITALRILLLLARIPTNDTGDPQTSSKRRIRDFAYTLEKTFFEEWNLDKAALSTRLSKKQFTKLFKEECRTTFLQRLTQLRMGHANSLLRKTDQSVLSIAFSCGYDDLSHFYRVFKQTHGCAPIQWREMN